MERIELLHCSSVAMSFSHRTSAFGPPGTWLHRLVARGGRWMSWRLAAVVGGVAGLATAIAPAIRMPTPVVVPTGEPMQRDAASAAFDGMPANASPSVARVLAPAAGIASMVPRDSQAGSP
jgi:hypothetical protein